MVALILNLPPETHIVVATLSEHLAYIALDSHDIVVYDLLTKQIVYSIKSYHEEDVIHI
jgi:hypothetical protein